MDDFNEQPQPIRVSRVSPVTGKRNTMTLNCRRGRLIAWVNGEGFVQELLPELDAAEREFLISGCTPDDWEVLEWGKEA
jgi:hypothetical protein